LLPDDVVRDEKLSGTQGTCYLVPESKAEEVLKSLDFREKGGYTREVVDVKLFEDGSLVRALVYSATADNPNFEPDLASSKPEALDKAAHIIATSTGPSGKNDEYLFELADALPDDAYLQALATRVKHLSAAKAVKP